MPVPLKLMVALFKRVTELPSDLPSFPNILKVPLLVKVPLPERPPCDKKLNIAFVAIEEAFVKKMVAEIAIVEFPCNAKDFTLAFKSITRLFPVGIITSFVEPGTPEGSQLAATLKLPPTGPIQVLVCAEIVK